MSTINRLVGVPLALVLLGIVAAGCARSGGVVPAKVPLSERPRAVKSEQRVRDAAVHNVLRSRIAQNGRNLSTLAARFAPFTAHRVLARTAATYRRALLKLRALGGIWTSTGDPALVVERWEQAHLDNRDASVAFIGYESNVRGRYGRITAPLKRYAVKLHWESRWKTVVQKERWLTSEGALAAAGSTMHVPGGLGLEYRLPGRRALHR